MNIHKVIGYCLDCGLHPLREENERLKMHFTGIQRTNRENYDKLQIAIEVLESANEYADDIPHDLWLTVSKALKEIKDGW